MGYAVSLLCKICRLKIPSFSHLHRRSMCTYPLSTHPCDRRLSRSIKCLHFLSTVRGSTQPQLTYGDTGHVSTLCYGCFQITERMNHSEGFKLLIICLSRRLPSWNF